MIDLAGKLGLQTVEIIYRGVFSFNIEQLLEMAKGVYKLSGKRREGIVVRSIDIIPEINDRISFKVLNNEYLLKEK